MVKNTRARQKIVEHIAHNLKKNNAQAVLQPCSLVGEGCSTSGLVIWISFHQKSVSS
jgi:hypothetical protein